MPLQPPAPPQHTLTVVVADSLATAFGQPAAATAFSRPAATAPTHPATAPNLQGQLLASSMQRTGSLVRQGSVGSRTSLIGRSPSSRGLGCTPLGRGSTSLDHTAPASHYFEDVINTADLRTGRRSFC